MLVVLQSVSIQVRSAAVKERAVLALSNNRLLAGLISFENKLYKAEKTSFANTSFSQKASIQ